MKTLKIVKIVALLAVTFFAIVASFAFGWFSAMISSDKNSWEAKRGHTEVNVRYITSAITNYYSRSGAWPCNRNGLKDVTFGKEADQSEVMKILLGLDSVKSLSSTSLLVIDIRALGPGDTYLDPWGMPYYITFDTDGDGSCTTERWGILKGRGPFVWSEGGGAITSWQSNLISAPSWTSNLVRKPY